MINRKRDVIGKAIKQALFDCLKKLIIIMKAYKCILFKKSLDRVVYFELKDKELVYVVNSKCACSSIKSTLMKSVGVDNNFDNYRDIHDLGRQFSKNNIHDTKKFYFSFVRNPYERLVSLYVNKFEDRKKITSVGFEYEFYLGGILKQSMSFLDFCKTIETIPNELFERHFKPQYLLLKEESAKLGFVGKLENIKDDWSFLVKKYGLENLEHHNVSPKYNYAEYYTVESFEVISRMYKRDVDHFGYQEEENRLKSYLELI